MFTSDRTWRPDDAYQWRFIDVAGPGWIETHDAAELTIQLQSDDGEAMLWIDCVVATPLPDKNDDLARHFPACWLSHVPEHGLTLGLVDHENVVAWRTPEMKIAWQQHNFMAGIIAGSNQLTSLSAGPEWAMVGTERGDLMLLETATGRLEKLHSGAKDEAKIHAVCLIPRQPWCAVGNANGTLKLVRLVEGEEVFRTDAHRRSIDALATTADGRLLVSGGRDGVVRVWRCEGSNLHLAYTLPDFSGPIRGVSFDRRGDVLAVVVQGERAVRIWKLNGLAEEFAARGLSAASPAPQTKAF
jgi:WD40 repeat protein